jgi:adenine phosphoribosyltransferase
MTCKEKLLQIIRVVEGFPKPGISFKDISPVLLDPELMAEVIEELSKPWKNKGITRVMGIESRGFLFGPGIAMALGAGFVIVRKAGKLPPATRSISYTLEYGEAVIEISEDALTGEDTVLIHDDLLATGGTAAAAAELASQLGAKVQGFSFLSELEFINGREKLKGISGNIESILNF